MREKAVCFDLGGVIVQIRHYWGEILSDLKIVPLNPRSDYGHLTDFSGLDSFQKGEMSFDEYLQELGTYLGGVSVDQCGEIHGHILWKEYPESIVILDELKSRGIGVACLSNTNEPHFRECLDSGRFPVCNRFDRIVTSFELGLNKPDIAIFSEFERAMGWEGKSILFFDDALINVLAAREIGWHAIKIDPMGDVGNQIRAGLNDFLSLELGHCF